MSSAAHSEQHAHRPIWFYTLIAIFLGCVTLVELGPLFDWYNIPAIVLLVMSAVKFFVVVAFFMHLWDDESIFTRVFVAPLLGAGLMVMVLMLLFYSYYPSPSKDSFALQERYYENFNGQCSSWLVSSVSNRTYCASGCSGEDLRSGSCNQALDRNRIAALMGDRGGAVAPPAFDITAVSGEARTAALVDNGKKVYEANCQVCHQPTGAGLPGVYPPLAGSDYLGDAVHHAQIVVHGLAGKIVVNGVEYNAAMAPFGALSDLDIASVATYERRAWGNAFSEVLPEDVAKARAAGAVKP